MIFFRNIILLKNRYTNVLINIIYERKYENAAKIFAIILFIYSYVDTFAFSTILYSSLSVSTFNFLVIS